jgi:hypothetical protein
MIKKRSLVVFSAALFLAAPSYSVSQVAAESKTGVTKPKSGLSTDTQFDSLAKLGPLIFGGRWNDGQTAIQRWEKHLTEEGFRQERAGTWYLQDGSGGLRVVTVVLQKEINLFLYLFPAAHDAIPAPLLSNFINQATSTHLGGGELEIAFAKIDSGEGVASRSGIAYVHEHHSISVQLQGGYLRKQANRIEIGLKE